MNGFKRRSLFAAAIVLLTPVAALAQDQGRELSATVHLSLTILPSATVGTRAALRGGNELVVNDYAGKPFDATMYQIVYRDSRGERALRDQGAVTRAIVESDKAGEHGVEITLVF